MTCGGTVVVFALVAGVWVLALIRLFAHHVPVLPLLFNWTPSLPYKVAFVDYRSGAIVRGDLVVYSVRGARPACRPIPGCATRRCSSEWRASPVMS
jgi:conjugal transfer pilin signal peptidase TrbI